MTDKEWDWAWWKAATQRWEAKPRPLLEGGTKVWTKSMTFPFSLNTYSKNASLSSVSNLCNASFHTMLLLFPPSPSASLFVAISTLSAPSPHNDVLYVPKSGLNVFFFFFQRKICFCYKLCLKYEIFLRFFFWRCPNIIFFSREKKQINNVRTIFIPWLFKCQFQYIKFNINGQEQIYF